MPINLEEESRAFDQLPEVLCADDECSVASTDSAVFGGSGALAAMLMRLLIK